MVENQIVVYEQRIWTVYVHTNIINNKKYVGITKQVPQDRWGTNGNRYGKNNKTTKSKFWNAIQKYGWDNFQHIILEQKYTHVEAKNVEMMLIRYFDSKNNGYNMTLGGDGSLGCSPSEETRKKIGFAAKRENLSEETRKKLHECHLRENLSVETRLKMSEAIKRRTTGFIKGSKHTELSREKIRRSHDKYRKSVICLNTLEKFKDVHEAAQYIHTDFHPIRNNCRGKTKSSGMHPITNERLHWMYLEIFNLLSDESKEMLYNNYFTGNLIRRDVYE